MRRETRAWASAASLVGNFMLRESTRRRNSGKSPSSGDKSGICSMSHWACCCRRLSTRVWRAKEESDCVCWDGNDCDPAGMECRLFGKIGFQCVGPDRRSFKVKMHNLWTHEMEGRRSPCFEGFRDRVQSICGELLTRAVDDPWKLLPLDWSRLIWAASPNTLDSSIWPRQEPGIWIWSSSAWVNGAGTSDNRALDCVVTEGVVTGRIRVAICVPWSEPGWVGSQDVECNYTFSYIGISLIRPSKSHLMDTAVERGMLTCANRCSANLTVKCHNELSRSHVP